MMTSEQTLNVLKAWFEAIEKGDGEKVMASMAQDITFVTPYDEDDAIIPYVGIKKG